MQGGEERLLGQPGAGGGEEEQLGSGIQGRSLFR